MSGSKDIEVNLREDLALIPSNEGEIPIVVSVHDETGRKYNTTVSVMVKSSPIKVEIDRKKSDMVYRSGTDLNVYVSIS